MQERNFVALLSACFILNSYPAASASFHIDAYDGFQSPVDFEIRDEDKGFDFEDNTTGKYKCSVNIHPGVDINKPDTGCNN